jgi:signal peptidase II
LTAKRARINDGIALLIALIIIGLDQWTKYLVITHLSPPQDPTKIVSLIGDYLTLYYIQNSGAAFSMFQNPLVLGVLILIAVCVIAYLYFRARNTGSLLYKLIFGMIIGGALANLLDRLQHGGAVVDFIWFRIPQIHFSFAIFNVADAAISVGIFFLFLYLLFGSFQHTTPAETDKVDGDTSDDNKQPVNQPLQSREQDA